MTQNPGKMPDFFIIGAMKAGTTTLYRHLLNHPDVGMSRMKETDFFILEKNFPLGFDWYSSQFPDGRQVCGEASPNYSKYDIFPGVPERIATAAPNAKIIVIVRDPVARFASHYRHSWLLGGMSVPPDRILASQNGQHMLESSRYAVQVEKYLTHFGIDRFLFLDFDELCSSPQRVMDQTFKFLGVATLPIQADEVFNDASQNSRMPRFVQKIWRSRATRLLDPLITRGMRDFGRKLLSRGPARVAPKLPEEVMSQVRIHLKEDADNFRKLTGKEFSSWSV